MRIITLIFLISLGTIASAQNELAPAPDVFRGELLYQNHCYGCHESQVHIREKHRAETLGDIQKQVARWSSELRLYWIGTDIQDVSHFLYKRYYFKEPAE